MTEKPKAPTPLFTCKRCGARVDRLTEFFAGDRSVAIAGACARCVADVEAKLASVRPICAAMRASGVPEAIVQAQMGALLDAIDAANAWPLTGG